MERGHTYEVVPFGHAWFRFSVASVAGVESLPLVVEAERIVPAGVIDAEYAIEMVDFVLQEFSESAQSLHAVSTSG